MNEIFFSNDTKKVLCPDTWRALLLERHDSSDNAFALVFPDEFSRHGVDGVFFFTSCNAVEELPQAEIISHGCALWDSVRLAHAAEQLQIVKLQNRSNSTLEAWVEELSQGWQDKLRFLERYQKLHGSFGISCIADQNRQKGKNNMASVEKFAASAAVNQIRHIERTIQNPSEPEHIDRSKRSQNYYLSPDKGMTSYDYYKHRMSELHCLKRGDVKPLAGWVITAPENLSPDNYESFFSSSYDYLCELFGEENCISCVCHMDEATPHLHFLFIPVVHTDKFPGGKISAKECLTKSVLRNFHPELQKHLDRNGIKAQVYTGVTARQGGNKTVRQLKQERQHTFEHQQQYDRGLF